MKALFKYLFIAASVSLLVSCEDEDYTTKSSLYGIVVDAADNTPIEGVVVTNQTTGKNCITKVDGRYEFNNLEFGKTYKIYAEKDGYKPTSQNITPSEVRDNIELNIRLERRP